jgi:hypothetical protein
LNSYLETGETVRFSLRKTKGLIVFMVIFFSVWMYFGVIFLKPVWGVIVLGDAAMKTGEYLIAGLIGLLVFIPIVLIIVLSYSLNQLIVTDRRVLVRRGLFGSIRIVGLGDIRSFQHVYSRSSRSSNHKIWFYLNCGELVKTGELFNTLGGLTELLELLRQNFEGRGFTAAERRQMKLQCGSAGQPVRKTIAVPVILMLLPLILAAVYAARYLTT